MAEILNADWDRFEVHSSLNIKTLVELGWRFGESRLYLSYYLPNA